MQVGDAYRTFALSAVFPYRMLFMCDSHVPTRKHGKISLHNII